jgi:hypothetical protein
MLYKEHSSFVLRSIQNIQTHCVADVELFNYKPGGKYQSLWG